MELVFEARSGRTVLAHAYAEPPFRIGRTFDTGDAVYVIVVCSGPGVFAGDTLRQSVRVAPGARVVLASQSALQAHPSAAAAPARIHHAYDVADDGELHCHWDPLIPFAGARVDQRFDIRIGETSRLYWSDALMSGRATRGEAWRFTELAHELALRGGAATRGRPYGSGEIVRYRERYRLRPADCDVTRAWVAGSANYLATALVHDSRATSERAADLQRDLDAIVGVAAGVDLLEDRLIVARLSAAAGPPFAAARAALRRRVLDRIFDAPHLAGRK